MVNKGPTFGLLHDNRGRIERVLPFRIIMTAKKRRFVAIALVFLMYSNAMYVIFVANPITLHGDVNKTRKTTASSSMSLETAISIEALQEGLASLIISSSTKEDGPPIKNPSVSVKVENLTAEQALGLWEQLKYAKDLFTSTGSQLNRKITPKKPRPKKGKYLRYNICNGLSNQLLIHAAYIARARQEEQVVQIPDYFIVNGVQTSDENVVPTASNSIPFGHAFDRGYFRSKLQEMGINATFVKFDFSKPQMNCAGVGMVRYADPLVVKEVLEAFRPSGRLDKIITQMQKNFRSLDTSQGVCVHHRDGQDWHDHCKRWGSIPDGVYRGNCLGVPNRTFVQSLQDRGLDTSKWIYYCGDHAVPEDLLKAGYKVVSRQEIISKDDTKAVSSLTTVGEVRDLWALVDFFVCRQLPQFIGNSVSTFSAIQIALKDGAGAYWYNTQSIPLASDWRVYQIPIVYTYTEMSARAGQHFLRSSIASVRRQMPNNKIHVLYHGIKDKAFRTWLADQGVIIHNHFPKWRNKIEQMRKNGDPTKSHLFLHPGNYLGTWQRIDIPLFLDSEYCLLLDSDTIINNPFTLADFGLNMTYGIAMSSEMHVNSTEPSNAGVTLMNIPTLRRTHADFLKFILDHVETASFNHSSPSDQGAYLVYYKNQTSFLQRSFNMKPYWPITRAEFQKSFVVHFHGPKPHEYLEYIMGKECGEALGDLCAKASKRPILCQSLREFAVASREVQGMTSYCQNSFRNVTQKEICESFLGALVDGTIECVPKKRVTLDDLERSLR